MENNEKYGLGTENGGEAQINPSSNIIGDETYAEPKYMLSDDDDDEDENDDDESGDWGDVDPLDDPNAPPSPMDPSAPGSAV
jgi:hypothetical protein